MEGSIGSTSNPAPLIIFSFIAILKADISNIEPENIILKYNTGTGSHEHIKGGYFRGPRGGIYYIKTNLIY